MLVPLTESLYVPGTLDDAHKVLIDIGTGYYVEVLTLIPLFTLFLGFVFISCLWSFFVLVTFYLICHWSQSSYSKLPQI